MTAIAPLTPTPSPAVPDRADRPTFSARATVWANWVAVSNVPQMAALTQNAYLNALDAFTSANNLSIAAAAASASAASAAASAGATLWVTGTAYAIGNQRISPITQRVYRRLAAGAGTIDPSVDAVNWAAVSTGLPVVASSALITQAQANTSYVCTSTGPRTNLLLRSNEFDHALWSRSQVVVSANSAVAPDGTLTADTVTISSASASNTYTFQVFNTVAHANQPFTGALDIKKGTFTGTLVLYLEDGAYLAVASVGISPSAGWLRYSVSGIFGAAPSANINILLGFSGGAVNETVFLANAQLETGLVASPHILSGATQGTAGPCLVLPPNPSAGDTVKVRPQRSLTNFVVGRNNQLFKGLQDDFTIDAADQAIELEYVNNSWEIT